ncbi:hypothetical protein OGAPHI_006298 [Ogataea philodendri]|uniref:Uncharacterized protein n=1 Tax=Ogataea philodendri TaxID=1378263 RepID=A0A9P8NYW5_9ASCO|nr:uncharacterized protein OGAPHI_006298 [Ogataea philodendri]KAH3662117.1 hypothetical protein OGAPHI_006298 [Ogataea philodendri]
MLRRLIARRGLCFTRPVRKNYFFYGNTFNNSNEDSQATAGPNIVDIINEINDDKNFKFDLHKPEKNTESAARLDKQISIFDGTDLSEAKPVPEEDDLKVETFMDTNKVWKQLHASGFSEEESTILLDLIRAVLKQKLTWLNQKFVPLVDIENEAYLFEAAHSELLVETRSYRETSLTDLTSSSIGLRRVFNMLQDETTSKLQLNDNSIKMILTQFKHENNLQQKRLNIRNQDLKNKIISELISGLRSEVETIRWALTRSGIAAILIMAVAIMASWNFTKNLKLGPEEVLVDGPTLRQIAEPADEESHDYEADWDERVKVHPSRYSSDAGTGLENSTCSKETLSPSLFGKETAAAHSVVSPMFVNGNDMPTRSFWAYMRSQSATNDAVSPTTGPFRPTARILECDVKRCTRYRFLALTSDSISLLDLFLSLATVLMLAPAENIGPLATRRVTRVDG